MHKITVSVLKRVVCLIVQPQAIVYGDWQLLLAVDGAGGGDGGI